MCCFWVRGMEVLCIWFRLWMLLGVYFSLVGFWVGVGRVLVLSVWGNWVLGLV